MAPGRLSLLLPQESVLRHSSSQIRTALDKCKSSASLNVVKDTDSASPVLYLGILALGRKQLPSLQGGSTLDTLEIFPARRHSPSKISSKNTFMCS